MPVDPREEYYEKRIAEDSDLFTPGDRTICELGLNLAYTFDLFDAMLQRSIQPHGISQAAFNLLKILQHHENQCAPLNEVGALLVTSRANVTGLVDGLAKKGLVERVPHPTDRRVKLARLLPAGEQLVKECLPGYLKDIEVAYSGTTPEERQQLIALLKKLRSSLVVPD